MIYKTTRLALAAAVIALPALAQDRPTGELIAMNCGTCHGTYGQSFGESMPPLAGMYTEAFVQAILAFRDDTRPGTIMSRIAPAFTEDDYRVIAEYYAQQAPVPYTQEDTQ